jgi:hypothetical protein
MQNKGEPERTVTDSVEYSPFEKLIFAQFSKELPAVYECSSPC